MRRKEEVDTAPNEEVLYATDRLTVAVQPDGWAPRSDENRTWEKGELETRQFGAAVIGREDEEEVVLRLDDGREYSYERAIEMQELGTDYVLTSGEWLALTCNQLPEKAAAILGQEYKEGIDRTAGTDVALVDA